VSVKTAIWYWETVGNIVENAKPRYIWWKSIGKVAKVRDFTEFCTIM
jgi:hypothetical protein